MVNTQSARFARTLALVHFAFLLGVLAGKPSELYGLPASEVDRLTISGWNMGAEMIAARAFHFTYEHPLVQVLTLVDVPSLIAAFLLVFLLQFFVHPVVSSYAAGALWLLLGTLQWYLIGKAVDRWRANRRSQSAPHSGLHPT